MTNVIIARRKIWFIAGYDMYRGPYYEEGFLAKLTVYFRGPQFT